MKTNIKFPNSGVVNKYTLTLSFFLVFITFFDSKYSLLKQHKLSNQIEELEVKRVEYEALLAEAQKEYEELINNKEKYARERYFISKEGEEVFIIE